MDPRDPQWKASTVLTVETLHDMERLLEEAEQVVWGHPMLKKPPSGEARFSISRGATAIYIPVIVKGARRPQDFSGMGDTPRAALKNLLDTLDISIQASK
jgi:hypothetical protein